jgi:hypothetical protein
MCTLSSAPARAEPDGQLWGTATVGWLATNRLSFRVQFQPTAQPADQPTFLSTDTTPRALYVVAPWLDVLGEIDFGTKNQSNEINSTSVTPRVGVQLHILSRILEHGAGRGETREHQPKRRLDFRTLLRFEDQRENSSRDSPPSSSWRFRDRFQVAYPLNRPKTTSDGAIYLTTDTEAFVPLDGGFINQFRVRSGFGYRPNFPWRFEALYIWTGERSHPAAPLVTNNHAFDLRVFLQF